MKINYRLIENQGRYILYRYSFIDTLLSEFFDLFVENIKKELKAELKGVSCSYKNGRNHKPNYNVEITKFILRHGVWGCHVLYDTLEKNIRINVFIYDD